MSSRQKNVVPDRATPPNPSKQVIDWGLRMQMTEPVRYIMTTSRKCVSLGLPDRKAAL